MPGQVIARLLARLALAAALVVAVQASLLHPLQHVDAKGGLVHVPGKDKTSSPVCDALAALGACVPDAPQAFTATAFDFQFSSTYLRAPRSAEAPPFLSQGPPSLV